MIKRYTATDSVGVHPIELIDDIHGDLVRYDDHIKELKHWKDLENKAQEKIINLLEIMNKLDNLKGVRDNIPRIREEYFKEVN